MKKFVLIAGLVLTSLAFAGGRGIGETTKTDVDQVEEGKNSEYIPTNSSTVPAPTEAKVTTIPATKPAELSASKPANAPTSRCPEPATFPVPDYSLVPIGPDHSIGNHIPEGLVQIKKEIETWDKFLCLLPEPLRALQQMDTAARHDGVVLVVISAYRDFYVQARLKSQETPPKNSLYPSVAAAGHSEHQLGTTIDFLSSSDSTASLDRFKNSPQYAWLIEHAHEYGFVQSYSEGTESITGYIPEAWHWRYVGLDIARTLRASGSLTLYEYLKALYEQGED